MLPEERRIILIHNHPKLGGASWADHNSATWLDAEWLLIVNPDGKVHRHQKIDGEIVELEPLHFPEFVEPVDPVETALHAIAYGIQTLLEFGNPAEAIFKQGETAEDEITVDTGSRLVSDFLLNPAAIVFLDDVAKEYGVEDTAFFGAMVATIIYRELQDLPGFGLPNADNPRYQHNWDLVKRLGQSLFFVVEQIGRAVDRDFNLEGRTDGDPSLGVGAISRESGQNIQSDAEQLDMTMYFPALGFDRPTTLDHMQFSTGEHSVIERFFVGSLEPDIRVLRAIPPSNEKEGVWRVEIPEFEYGPPASLREQYEPTLGILAAEVAIAMQTPQYKLLGTDEERTAYIIGYHANRSRVPNPDLYDLSDLAEDSRKQTRTEIGWAREFEGLMDDRRANNQANP